MSSTNSRKSYPPVPDKGKYSVVEDSKKKTSLLKDNSWIKKEVNDEKVVDVNSNFGRAVLSRFKSTENIESASEHSSSTVTTITSTGTPSSPSKSSVHSLSKRFSTSQDELDSSSTTLKSGTKTTTVTTSRTSMVKSPTKTDTFAEKIFSDSRTSAGKLQTPLKPVDATTKSVTKTETVTVTSKDSTFQDSLKTVKPLAPKPVAPAKTTKRETYTVTTSKDNTVQVDSSSAKLSPPTPPPPPPMSPTKNTKTETVTVTTFQDTIVREDSKTAKSAPPMSPTKNTKTETVTVTTFKDTIVQEGNKSAFPTSPTKRSVSSSDDVFDTLLPTSIKSTYASDTRSVDKNDKSSGTSTTTYTRRSYTDSRPEEYVSESVKTVSSALDSYEYSNQRVSTKTYTSTSYGESRPEEFLDTYTSRTLQNIYTSPDRKIVEKDLCTLCQKPMLADTKMILEDMDIRCHASCFKCDVCKSPLGHLKAGDSMWVYRRTVQCETCFGATKSKWHR